MLFFYHICVVVSTKPNPLLKSATQLSLKTLSSQRKHRSVSSDFICGLVLYKQGIKTPHGHGMQTRPAVRAAMNLPGAETPGYQADDTGLRPKKGLYGTAASSGVSNLFGS
jgi:hypothetical protein